MQIKAVTKYDYEVYKDFAWFNMFHSSLSKKVIGLLAVIMTLMLLFDIMKIFRHNEDSGAASIVFWVIFIVIIFIAIYFITPKLSYAFSKKLADIENKFIFEDDELLIISENTQYSGTSTIKYEMLDMIYDTSKYFYIYIDTVQAFIVKKGSISKEEAEKIGQAFKMYLPAQKYVIRKK